MILHINGICYKILNFIIHEGENLNCGHYINLLRHEDQWISVNNTRIENLRSLEYIENAYVVLLKKIND